MRIQKQTTRQGKGKKYYKYVIVLPPGIVKRLGWSKGTELESSHRRGRLILRAKWKKDMREQK